MRRAFAAALALLLTGAPVVAAACALACPAPAASAAHAEAMTSDMPADCAAMHHAAAAPRSDGRPQAAAAARPAPMPDAACCAMTAAPVDLPPAAVDNTAPVATAIVPAATTLAFLATVDVPARGPAPPPGDPHARARRTDILRL